ncbi:hypothetical protein TNCV_4911531 [Trichonephila clavipes]|nr:hypothetical protein TNCV_4911531 [Trichonephila clavipes]
MGNITCELNCPKSTMAFGIKKLNVRGDCRIELPPVKFDVGGIIVWGSLSWYGLGLLIPIHGNADSYSAILDNKGSYAVEILRVGSLLLFQHYITTFPVARSITDWYDDIDVNRMDRPVKNADLKLVENVCVELNYRIHVYSKCPTSGKELTYLLHAEWKKIHLPMIRRVKSLIVSF